MKKSVVLFVGIALASLLQASELWWTVSTPVTLADTSTSPEWNYAKLYATDTGFNYGSSTVLDQVSQSDLVTYGGQFTDIGTYGNSAYSFYVELLNGDSVVGRSFVSLSPQQGAVKYSDLAGHLEGGNIMNPTAASSAYSFNTFTTADVIPEPTSGLLVLFGMMALGLKRKRV